MKLFNRGSNSPTGPAASVVVPVQPEAPAAAAVPREEAPDVTAVLDASMKEISEKVTRLASTVENQHSDRSTLEAKLAQLDDRMRKLASLTEMISAPYNPFVGDAPPPREALPTAEAGFGLAPPPLAAVSAPVAAAEAAAAPAFPPVAEPPVDAFFETQEEALAAPAASDEFVAFETTGVSVGAPSFQEFQVDRFPIGFETSALVLRWANLMLRNAATREDVVEMVSYYHNLGWIGDVARDQLLAYANGIAHKPATGERDAWRADVEFHEHSLLFLEKLRALAGRA